jgi:hypothetical protein
MNTLAPPYRPVIALENRQRRNWLLIAQHSSEALHSHAVKIILVPLLIFHIAGALRHPSAAKRRVRR